MEHRRGFIKEAIAYLLTLFGISAVPSVDKQVLSLPVPDGMMVTSQSY